MSLSPGEITSGDLSPNAGILGTQLADNTIQLRNLTDDTFRIVNVYTKTVNASSLGTAYADSFAHGLSTVPLVMGNVLSPFTGSNTYWPIPYYQFDTTAGYAVAAIVWVDSTSIHYEVDLVRGAANVGIYTFKFYVLQESAN